MYILSFPYLNQILWNKAKNQKVKTILIDYIYIIYVIVAIASNKTITMRFI